MIFSIVGSECAPGILARHPVVAPDGALPTATPIDFGRLFALDRVPMGTPLDFHHVPGRLRLKADALKKDSAKLNAVCRELDAIPGVRSVTPNRLTGSILVHYEPLILRPAALSAALQECRLPPADEAGVVAQFGLAERLAGFATQKLLQWLVEKLAVALVAAVV
jgi:hypothetical protein